MARGKDLTGMKFGRLTVIERHGSDKHGKALWLCKCDCGNEVIVRGNSLISCNTTSCGCSRKEDLIGQRFGRLTVVSYNEEVSKQKGRAYWNCKCDCGNEVIVRRDCLKNSHTTSCGCYKKDKIKEQWQDEDYRQMQSEQKRRLNEEMWKDEGFRQIRSDKMSGDGNPSWKGGITPISDHLRKLQVVSQWRKDTYIRENNRCQLTGKKVHDGNSDVHHLYGFNIIVLEAHELHNIQIHEIIGDYTQEELHKLEDYIAEWHKDISNAVLLSKEVHELFHNCKDEDGNVLYGKGNNTPEQFEEFKQRYLNGEFNDLLGDDLND